MPFIPPNFNILANVWHGECAGHVFPGGPPGRAPDMLIPCQLYLWPKSSIASNFFSADGTSFSYTLNMMLRVAKLVDLRDVFNASGNDLVEVPAGSNRWYYVTQVDDEHKGFTNEYRFAFIAKCFTWPTPIP